MTQHNGHVDGDDYTWQAGPVQVGTVFKPSGTLAELREQRSGEPDLRTADQVERDDAAQLALRCDNLVDALAAANRRINVLEAAFCEMVETIAALMKVLEVRL